MMSLKYMKTYGRAFKLLLIVLLIGAFTYSAAAANIAGSNILSWTGDPATTMTVTWRGETDTAPYVQYTTQAEYDRTGFKGAAQVEASCKDISLDGSGAWHYEAEMTGLAPATRYVYRTGGGSAWSGIAAFTTADPRADSFSFTYMGDIQVVNDAEAEYARWGELAQAAYSKAPDIAFGLLGGDIVESGISLPQFDSFVKNASPVFGNVPLMPTNGNHESNFLSGKPELYLNVFALPQNGPEGFTGEFYSFDYGNCHVTVLNSWVFSGEQKLADSDLSRISAWIQNDLQSSSATWKIVVLHNSPYPVFSDAACDKVRANWAPLFEKYGVSLVFVGHQHVYSRSYPMYDGGVDYEKGIVYIMGDSGQKFYGSADERYSERTIYNTATYQLVRVDGNTLTVQTYDIAGNELDQCTLSLRIAEFSYPDVSESDWFFSAARYVVSKSLVVLMKVINSM